MLNTIEKKSSRHRIKQWNNKDVTQFYENIPIEKLRSMAIHGGFEDCCDILQIKDQIWDSKTLLDAGSGYGRVVSYLLKNNFLGKITAVERSHHFIEHLQNNFSNKVNIVDTDIMNFFPKNKFDVILSMWSNISEFPKEDQPKYIKKLLTILNPNGTLILDTISHLIKPKNVEISSKQNYFLESEYGNAFGYLTSSEEIQDYADELNCELTQIPYLTTTSRQRIIHIIKNR